ncbi:unnamed protein product [Blepharisma stoltei]|uniref:Sulfite exporter TauE/SafE family protein n=1 Tax=Blepharisma stoltei TaxID=1481888 RepID=A0AAU9IBK2_9CILI|nr:unnamed protein product [Blepharisma stoltei]
MKKVLILLILSQIIASEFCEHNYECKSLHNCVDGECMHKDLFPIAGSEFIGTFINIIISALSTSAGLGGGPLNTIVGQLLFNYDLTHAIPLSQVVIFGGTLMSVCLKLNDRHPTIKSRPLTDYELISYLIVPLLAGTSVGVFLHLIFPEWLIIVTIIIVKIYISILATQKWWLAYKKENLEKVKSEASAMNEILKPLMEEDTNQIIEIKEREPRMKISYSSIGIVGIVYVIVVLGSFIRGGKGMNSIVGITQCDIWYWIYTGFYFFLLVAISWLCGKLLVDRTQRRIENGYDFDLGDPKWNSQLAIKIGLITAFAGLLAGSLGIGGGMIMNPFMISIGIRPEVSTSCSNFMILFSASISVLQYTIGGMIELDYGLWLLGASLIGAILGYYVLRALLRKVKRPSMIVLLIAFLTTASLIGIASTGIFTIIEEQYFGFSSLC